MSAVDTKHDRPIAEIQQEFGQTIEDVKQRFGLLLDLRDQRIQELQGELAGAAREKPKPRLLIVDDAESTPEIFHRYLEGQHVELSWTAADEASSHLDSQSYDCVIVEATSVIAPDVDGLDVCRSLCEAGRADKVIVMSSRPGDGAKNTIEEVGARFLRKPFRRAELIKHVLDMLLQEES